MTHKADESFFVDRRAAWHADAKRKFEAWLDQLPAKEKVFLTRRGIVDFEARLESDAQRLLVGARDDPDESLELRAEHARHPNGYTDFETEFLEALEPPEPGPESIGRQTARDVLSSILAEILSESKDNMVVSLLGLCVAIDWGAADGLTVQVAARRVDVAADTMHARVIRWQQLLAVQQLSRESLSVIHAILDEVMLAGNVCVSVVTLAVACGFGLRFGFSATELANRCGVSRQNISKEAVAWRARLGFSAQLGGGKSSEQRVKFRDAQLERAWRRTSVRHAAQIDSADQ